MEKKNPSLPPDWQFVWVLGRQETIFYLRMASVTNYTIYIAPKKR